MPHADGTTHFGFQQVPLPDKQARVDDVFRSVARRYDLMNDLMSGGLHRAWKNALVTAANPPRAEPIRGRRARAGERPFRLLDIAGGTGDIAFRLLEAGGPATRATVVDINAEMLEIGRARAAERGLDQAIAFVEGNAEALPFSDRSFDAVTIAFGIRNVPRIDAALTEAHRVLRLGGHFLCLEFSTVDVPGLDLLYDLYSFNVIPTLGRAVAASQVTFIAASPSTAASVQSSTSRRARSLAAMASPSSCSARLAVDWSPSASTEKVTGAGKT